MKKSERIPSVEIQAPESGEIDLYQKREKIYTRKVEGFYQRIRLFTGWPLLLGYFLLPWLTWDGRPAVLFDLPARKFHIFHITLWPQDLPLLAWLLIIAAFALFTVTMWAGRVWCGYTCPQTVWTAIFMWAEEFAEGSRHQRIKLDQAPWSAEKVARKTLKHVMWFGFAFLTGVTFVGYFTPIRELLIGLFTLDAHFWSYAWTVFFTGATYINAGWLREQVCIYMCPYARFQAAMFDRDTLIVSYDKERGEPRGARKVGTDPAALSLGDCIDCSICVQVCPTGIDIRDGLQYECINCALCIDACNEVMDRMGYARGLIRYTTENALDGKPTRMLRPRLMGYAAILLIMAGLFVYTVLTRVPVGLDVVRERTQLYRETSDGLVENTYLLTIRNMSEQAHEFEISMRGLEGAQLVGSTRVEVAGGAAHELPLRLTVDPAALTNSNVDIEFVVEATDEPSYRATTESRFLGPRLPR
ncbi:MAG: cytochrome c oxidase accessory protein CcoG [Spongiibacteraceae bacterium]|jgi:cytochrome c oxidase accessory protein FixG|nr:cytochrome c oxidase accessory protein CcoG [Spongiibacteraceae bacterium]